MLAVRDVLHDMFAEVASMLMIAKVDRNGNSIVDAGACVVAHATNGTVDCHCLPDETPSVCLQCRRCQEGERG